MANIKPIADRVFLEAIEEDRVTKSGIVLPDTAEKERPVKGRVVAVGGGKRNDRGELSLLTVKVGDTVLFKKYGPDEVEIEGKKYLVAEESDILAILEQEISLPTPNISTPDLSVPDPNPSTQNQLPLTPNP